jgi:translation initiation factor IF-2
MGFIEANPTQKISDDVYNVLCGQFAGDRGKRGFKRSRRERKRKRLYVLREKKLKRNANDEEVLKQQQKL